ncbi:IS30 family transposase [Streptomyces sp. NPDC007355]|uniref:IS30 family transposase n=1 Tax=Streptomyces sp. NPDC007355 TaxID=3364778 RepID=UPI0036B35EBE
MYRALFAGLLGRRNAKLRTGRTRRKRQRRGVPTPNKIKNMTLIHQRPAEINNRAIYGHWEGDLIIGHGHGSAIGTLVERTTRYVQLIHLPHGWKAPQVRDALIAQTAGIPPQMRKTLPAAASSTAGADRPLPSATGPRPGLGPRARTPPVKAGEGDGFPGV